MIDELKIHVAQRHLFWCARLEEFGESFGVTTAVAPALEYFTRTTNAAGKYQSGKHTCLYSIPYAIHCGLPEYDQVIAHEVCHGYQRQFMPESKWHGDFFLFLLRTVCGFNKGSIQQTIYHNYEVAKVKKIHETIREFL